MRSLRLFLEPGRPAERPLLAPDLAERIAAVLRAGQFVFRVNGTKPDTLDPTRTVGRSTLTDGQWVWSQGDIHYIETYRLAPDPDFVAACVDRDFRPRRPTAAEVDEVRTALQRAATA